MGPSGFANVFLGDAMPITHNEEIGSYGGTLAVDRSSATALSWIVRGTDLVDDMVVYLGDLAPATILAENGRLLVFKRYEREQLGRKVWRWKAHYQDEDKPEQEALDFGEYELDFDTSGSTVKITSARQQTSYAPAGATAPNFGTAIDVQPPEFRPAGADVVIPGLKFSVRYKLPKQWITAATKWKRILAWRDLTGSTNLYKFGPFDPGECLFLGVTGKISTGQAPEMVFHFLASENRAGFQVGNVTVASKLGHELLWILWEDAIDNATTRRVSKVSAVYVSQLYEKKSWQSLGCKL